MKLFYYFLFVFSFFTSLINAQEFNPDFTVMIPMRDGVELPTDLYFPSSEKKNLPCILVRSPAGTKPEGINAMQCLKDDYVIAVQSTRSSLDQEGKTFPFISDGWGALQDGYDTVEWLAKSPYTNGKIGTWGASALGITQLLMAPSHPPHLQSQYIMFAAGSVYHHGLYPGGQLLKHQAESWLGYYARDTGVLNYISQRPFYNDFWKQLNSIEVSHQVNAPALHVGGWYDTFLEGTLDSFTSRQYRGGEGAKGKQKLIIGPWTHFWPYSQHFGDFAIPKQGALPPVDISPKRWFDFTLRNISNGIEKIPPVTYYVMGPFDGESSKGNVWKSSTEWPVPAKPTPFYLTSDFQLQTSIAKKGNLSYRYDPKNVITTLGGRNLFLESGPKDQRSIENRPDVLVFTTPKLIQDVEVTGPISASLFFSSSQKDTDVILRLCDVYPDGRSILISEGVYRLGINHQTKEKEAYKENRIYKIEIDLWSTSIVFAKGHAIRLSVSSSNYPRYETNLNIGLLQASTGKHLTAINTVYVGEEHVSHIVLPIVAD